MAAIALSVGATPAGAIVAKIGGHGYGITPIGGAAEASLVSAYGAQPSRHAPVHRFDEPPLGGSELETEGGPVMHSVTTHVIFWDPPTSQFTATTKAIVNSFFTDVGHDSGLPTNVFAVAGQYTDSTGNAAYSSTPTTPLVDSHAYPTTGNCTAPKGVDEGPYAKCLFDGQLQVELKGFIEEEELPTGPTQLYFVLLPHNVATCLPETFNGKQVCSNNFYCAYHSFIEPGTANEIIYADIPFSLLDTSFAKGCQADGNSEIQLPNGDRGTSDTETRFADVALKYISHEYIEAVTDPLVNFDTAWVDAEGLEVADKCNSIPFTFKEEGEPGFDKQAFTPPLGGTAEAGTLFNQSIDGGAFYLQSEWDNAASACLMKPLPLSGAAFSSTAAVAGAPVDFNGSAADPYGAFEPTWTFGDGATGLGASPSHSYATAGEFTVTMTPRDALTGSTASAVSHTITVAAPPSPPPITTSTSTTSTSTSTASTAPSTPPPSPSSAFAARVGTFSPRTGAITLTESVANPGTFRWLAAFQNGKFGAFASASRCKAGRIRLAGKCRLAKIVFAKGSKTVVGAGKVSFTLKPSPSAVKALKNALRKGRGVPVSITLTFQSSLGGSPVTRVLSLTVKLKK